MAAPQLDQTTPRRNEAPPRHLRVTVLAGGPSSEREISLESGQAVAEALRRRGHTVEVLDVAPDNLGALDTPTDVIFPALHGAFGEDGQVQRILESRGVPFVGAGSAASAVAIDKVRTKQEALALGIRTPEFECVTSVERITLSPPVVVKPVNQGSSILIEMVPDTAALDEVVLRLIDGCGTALIERLVRGREITVGILKDAALPPLEIAPARGFYDYDAKYLADNTEYSFNTGLPAAALERMQADSLRLYRAIGCRHLARVDWIVDSEGLAWMLELNTLPGFTSHSLLPKAANQVGISFDELIERLVFLAYEDRP